MLSLFKKNPDLEVKVPTKPEETSAFAESGMVAETGKPYQYRDPKTGEFVYQVGISPDARKSIMGAIQKNAGLANQFIVLNRQRLQMEEQVLNVNKMINESENRINEEVKKAREELKLDGRWGLNMQLGVLERRDPPNG